MPSETMLDRVASDLALWIDETATRIALAMAPQGTAPFSAQISETQKLEYYRNALFNADGTPNVQGRAQELQRLGAQGFTQVYKAVLKAYPELRLPTPPGAAGGVPTLAPEPAPPSPVPTPYLPRSVQTAQQPTITPIIPAMASGGIVTQPTVALIGEAGPEAVVPLADYQYQQPNYFAGTPDQQAPPPASHEDIVAYIRQAAVARKIDPDVALAVALHEGTNPATGRFDNPAQEAVFPTGRSYWPYQLHYGGASTPYAQWGGTAGLGNDFTRKTGYQPGDPAAWQPAVDFALDTALQRGWYPTFYGSQPAKVTTWQGIPRRTA